MTDRDESPEQESADDVLFRALRLLGEMTAVVIEARDKSQQAG